MSKVRIVICTAFAAVLLCSCTSRDLSDTKDCLKIDELGIFVDSSANREYSYTDKKAAYFYGRTHQDNFEEWFAGWNIAKKRIFSDYQLYAGVDSLRRKDAQVEVFPDRLIRKFKSLTEVFSMVDEKPVLFIRLSDVQTDSVGISLHPSLVKDPVLKDKVLFLTPAEADGIVAIAPYKDVKTRLTGNRLIVPSCADGFMIVYAKDRNEVEDLITGFRSTGEILLKDRKDRMQHLICEHAPVKSNSDSLDCALSWLKLTTDQLITNQQGQGIYAGLPWFNEYWGRDMFISMPGATLVTGQFEYARQILKDFSKFQDKDPQSKTWGRIPNRANLEGILYNTTDGTPRFVIQIQEYLKYSGDKQFLSEIYPSVVLSIDAALANYTDTSGFLTHSDTDTWMDVKRNGKAGSPRGNRANDIQALWYGQLVAGVQMAKQMNDQKHAIAWEFAAHKLKRNFESKFTTGQKQNIADHLNVDDTQDSQIRPNQLYAFELVSNDINKMWITKRLWQELVYPWGVASLSQKDPEFHPYHENWNYYHKDDAYHNGTVWLWNNGIAMQRMIEYNQEEIAFQLFENMNRQALVEGAVGSLAENADALPREGERWAKRSGTFLQAWSNAEQLRVWYQYFLGIRPDMIENKIFIEPKLPSKITELTFQQRIGEGVLKGVYSRNGSRSVYEYVLDNQKSMIVFHLWPFLPVWLDCQPDTQIRIELMGTSMNVMMKDDKGKIIFEKMYEPDEAQVQTMQDQNTLFEGTSFAVPFLQPDLKSLKKYSKTPIHP